MKLLISIILISSISLMNCCICKDEPKHPQEKICESDYVIIANIIKLRPESYYTNVMFKIEKNLKINNTIKNYIQEQTIYVLYLPRDCSPELYENQTYVIAGKFDFSNRTQMKFNRCDYVKQLNKIDSEELYGITGNYDRGCSCRIKFCDAHCSYHAINECNWNSGLTYEIHKYTCLPLYHHRCVWTREGKSQPYLNTIHNKIPERNLQNLDFADSNGQHHHHVLTHDIFNSRHQKIYHETKNIRHNHPIQYDRTPYPNQVYYNDYNGKDSFELDDNMIRFN